ncbi:MAG: hypothetical protein IPN84_16805 [Sphingomonadales bacterium]|nr:hypothetical protein [Sphingomonadales bacterium]
MSVPLTRFHNNTGEFLDLALVQPVTLTKHDRVVLTICEAGYFERLEAFAAAHGGPCRARRAGLQMLTSLR